MITFEEKPDAKRIIVRLDGKKVGDIRKVDGGYAYCPKGAVKYCGPIMESVDAVKRSVRAV